MQFPPLILSPFSSFLPPHSLALFTFLLPSPSPLPLSSPLFPSPLLSPIPSPPLPYIIVNDRLYSHLYQYQVFPGELLAPTYLDPSDRECTIARTEVECRQPYMEQLEAQVGRSHPALVDLVKQCLHNAPERRPSTEEVLSRVRDVKLEVEGAHGNITRQLNITNILVLKELKQKDRTILEMQVYKLSYIN